MKTIIKISIAAFVLLFFSIIPNYGQASDKLVYIASPDVKGLEKGTNTELFKTILLGKLEEYALNADYQSVAREEAMNYIQNEIMVQQSGGVSSESIVKLGEWTGANYILVSSVVGSNGYGTIKLNLYETESGRLMKVKSTSFQEEVQDYGRQVDKVCRDLFGLAKSSPEQSVPVASAVNTSIDHNTLKTEKTLALPGINFYISVEDEFGFLTWHDAQRICSMKGTGWRLPTLDELKMMYLMQRQIKNLNGLNNNFKYWSSEEKNKRNAYYFDMRDGDDDDDDKADADKCVRCVKNK